MVVINITLIAVFSRTRHRTQWYIVTSLINLQQIRLAYKMYTRASSTKISLFLYLEGYVSYSTGDFRIFQYNLERVRCQKCYGNQQLMQSFLLNSFSVKFIKPLFNFFWNIFSSQSIDNQYLCRDFLWSTCSLILHRLHFLTY